MPFAREWFWIHETTETASRHSICQKVDRPWPMQLCRKWDTMRTLVEIAGSEEGAKRTTGTA
jgi:hypothetical protein